MPAVCRVGDALTTGHSCAGSTIIVSSNTNGSVRANGISIIVVGALTASHAAPPFPFCPPHVRFLNTGSFTVRINGIPIGRVGDSADSGAMIFGSFNVLCGG